MLRALLLENIDPVASELLSSAGYEVKNMRGALDEAGLAAALDGVRLLGIRSKTHVTRTVLERHPHRISDRRVLTLALMKALAIDLRTVGR